MADISPYHLVELGLTKHHRSKIHKLEHDDTPVKIRTHIHPGSGNWLPIWKHEAEHLEKKGTGMVTFTRQHIHDALHWPSEHRGGILPILAAIAPYVLPVLAGLASAGGIAAAVATAVNQGKQAATVGHGLLPVEPGFRATHDYPNTTFDIPPSNYKGQGVW
jgi:hypothetical protein